jgi:CHAT domain-containing protein/predicted negative regulator of RcsB-dependent stress response
MMRVHCIFRMVLILFFVFLLLGCLPRMAVKETAHYKVYENIELIASTTTFGAWTKTEIHIPKGAIVTVMTKGELWDPRNPGKWHWQPSQSLRFKVGEDGREIHLEGGIDYLRDPFNLNATSSGNGGFLYFGMGTWWRNKDPRYRMGKFISRVIVWEKERQDQIEGDLLELIRTHPKDQQFRDTVAMMANCFNQTGEYQRVQNLLKMIRDNPEIDWARVYPSVLNACAFTERLLGRYERAKAYLEESLNRSKPFGNRYMESSILRQMAQAASNLRQYEEANRLLEQSLKIAKELNHPEFIGNSLYSIGENLFRMNKPDEAVKYLENALEQFYQSDRWLMQRWCHIYLGYSYMRLNKNTEAKRSLESAIMIATKVADPLPQFNAHIWLGRMSEREGENQKAFEHYAEAIKILESTRTKFTDPTLKALFIRDRLAVYEWMIQLLLKMRRPPEALHYLERARARVFLDMLGEKIFSSKKKEENDLLTKERSLRQQIESLSGETGPGPSRGGERLEEETVDKDAEMVNEKVLRLRRLQSEHLAILEKIEKLNPELASLVSINPLKAEEIQVLLEEDDALLEYFVGQAGRFIFVVTKEKVKAVRLTVDSKKIFENIQEFRDRAVEGITLDRLLTKIYKNPLMELYEILIQPVEKEISGKKHLVIVPHGMLHYLPFQALLSKEGKYLIESYTISYLPSASVLKYARWKNKGNRLDLFAVGNPFTELSPLPAAEMEVKEVSAIFEKKLVLTGRQATKPLVKGQGPKYDIVLLSTHGEMIDSDPLKSNLRFTPSGSDDGKLTVSEIFDMEIKANMVTLSACETALVKGEEGDFPKGDDLVGLSRAFIHAGAPSVVASLWKVSDESTVKLMKTFYKNLQSMPKAEALQKAQMDLMKSSIRFGAQRGIGSIIESAGGQLEDAIECSHPFFWAPFILVGDWR